MLSFDKFTFLLIVKSFQQYVCLTVYAEEKAECYINKCSEQICVQCKQNMEIQFSNVRVDDSVVEQSLVAVLD